MTRIIALTALVFFTCTSVFSQTKAGKVDTVKNVVYYTCSHHPGIMKDKPGTCPECGMELTQSNKEKAKAEVMKNYTCPLHVDVVSHDPGKCPKCGKKLNLSPKEQMKAEVTKMYTCPMHPEVALDKDGVCPKCGKDLIEKKTKN